MHLWRIVSAGYAQRILMCIYSFHWRRRTTYFRCKGTKGRIFQKAVRARPFRCMQTDSTPIVVVTECIKKVTGLLSSLDFGLESLFYYIFLILVSSFLQVQSRTSYTYKKIQLDRIRTRIALVHFPLYKRNGAETRSPRHKEWFCCCWFYFVTVGVFSM